MTNLKEIVHIVSYEMKMQARSWVFRLFVLISMVGIVACHFYWQGEGNCTNWKMVALPCSMPLVNAYLFGVVQSLFLIVMMAGVSRRMGRMGSMEAIEIHPFNNVTYYWGVVVGNFLLFLLVNVLVVLVSIFAVNLTSLAPVGWKYYIFYLLTLNFPAWVFVAGTTLWLGSVTSSRLLAIVIPVIWWMGCILWLPYWQHGTLDYLASGVPNLFSEMIGHLNVERYVLHRLVYLLVGGGLLTWSVNGMRRLPNYAGRRKIYASGGILLVTIGGVCGVSLECCYNQDREFRAECRDSFTRNWSERTCRVGDHDVTLTQSGSRLTMRSDLMVYNPGKELLEQIVLFLNPGLEVTGIVSGKDHLAYRRDKQAILIARSLGAGDSLRIQVDYSGVIDDRFCDLHLRDTAYENAFDHDRFFATGRRGAFVEENLLVLTPACAWYPVAFPPVNPLMPMATGRDFTRFRLEVKHPLQKVVISQGDPEEREDGIVFTCRENLSGISLCGANYQRDSVPMNDKLGLQLNTMTWKRELEKVFSKMGRADFVSLWDFPLFGASKWSDCQAMSWYSSKVPYLYLLEVPVSFRLDSHTGKPEAGLVEPGMMFLRERGFDLNVVELVTTKEVKDQEDLFKKFDAFYSMLFGSVRRAANSHPLMGLGKKGADDVVNDHSGGSLWGVQDVWVHSMKYPFMGKIFDDMFSRDFNMARGMFGLLSTFAVKDDGYDFSGNSLTDMLSDNREFKLLKKLEDLWARLVLKIPSRELRQSLDSLYDCRKGEVDCDSLILAWSARWGVNVEEILEDWITTKHDQYYKVKDVISYYDRDSRLSKMVGKIMNAGKSGGTVAVEYGAFNQVQRSVCYLNPGEAKAFTIVSESVSGCITTGLSANCPTSFAFQLRGRESTDEPWEIGEEWHSIPVAEFKKDDDPNEWIVDDQDPGFELKDGNLSWLQRWRKQVPPLVANTQMGGDAYCWQRVVDAQACGDSIRGYHYICGGSGKSTATWRFHIPEAGRYRVMGKVYKAVCVSLPTGPVTEVVYYYSVFFGDQKEDVEVNLDVELSREYDNSCWASLGEFDFPAGEVSVTLSNKEIKQRKEIAIVADAVKFVKLE